MRSSNILETLYTMKSKEMESGPGLVEQHMKVISNKETSMVMELKCLRQERDMKVIG